VFCTQPHAARYDRRSVVVASLRCDLGLLEEGQTSQPFRDTYFNAQTAYPFRIDLSTLNGKPLMARFLASSSPRCDGRDLDLAKDPFPRWRSSRLGGSYARDSRNHSEPLEVGAGY
jgi:hypothetical protein